MKGDDNYYIAYTYWAQSKNFIAVKASKNNLKLFDKQSKEKKTFKSEIGIEHILYLSNDLFLVLTYRNAYRVDGKTSVIEKIELEDAPYIIYTGTTLEDNYFFLHVKLDDQSYGERVYDLKGNLISKIEVPDNFR